MVNGAHVHEISLKVGFNKVCYGSETRPLLYWSPTMKSTQPSCQHIFERDGYRVDVTNGVAALDAARHLLPDLISA
jgi:hypothetical protein